VTATEFADLADLSTTDMAKRLLQPFVTDQHLGIRDRCEKKREPAESQRNSEEYLMEETWLPAPNAPGYQISNTGRVRSVDRLVTYRNKQKPRWVPGCERKLALVKGYKHLALNIGGVKKNFYVHLLVCEAFHGPRPSPLHEARHLNGIATDNRAENLAWGTKKENAQDSIRHGTNKERNKTHCKRGHPFPPDRRCRICALMLSREWYRRNRVAVSTRSHERYARKAREEGRTLRRRPSNAMYATQPDDNGG
jgi:hypothetical protein